MAKQVRKPVKRKGYQAGGYVADPLDEALVRAPRTKDTENRYLAARNAITSAQYNEMSPKEQAEFRKNPMTDTSRSGRTVEDWRADYPGFAKGGKVKKVAPARKKGKR